MIRPRFFLLLSVLILVTALCSSGEVFISVAVAPPPLPVYVQPICPAPGYIWVPGYWSWGPAGYFWVPGTWALPPDPGLLWTPGYWGFIGGMYRWHVGYWGPVVGFYGGINYGFGYSGYGYDGGYWHDRHFYYNRAVNNVNITNVHYVYNRRVENNVHVGRVSYNGGPHGIQARPTSAQMAAERGHHMAPTSAQTMHERQSRNDRAQFASVNHGRPQVAATSRPSVFNGHQVAHATQSQPNHPQQRAQIHAPQRSPAKYNQPAGRQPPQQRAQTHSPQQHAPQRSPARYNQPAGRQPQPNHPQQRAQTPSPHGNHPHS